jgi:hypothetical protein
MNSKKRIIKTSFLVLVAILFVYSCDSLTDVNKNPNGISPSGVDPNLLMSTVLTKTADKYLKVGYGIHGVVQGAVQQVQKSTHTEDMDYFDWNDESWGDFYTTLNDNQEMYNRAKDEGNNFIMGVALTMESFNFGLVADLWGPAPYSKALKGGKGGNENSFPAYDSQKDIYMGVIDSLKKAVDIFKNVGSVEGVNTDADVYYHGDVEKWQRFANSLLLRYYMRLSSKMPDVAQKGVESIAQSGMYIQNDDESAVMSYLGNNPDDSWPGNTKFGRAADDEFRRVKLCATFGKALKARNDPRLGLWFEKVDIPIVISDTKSPKKDEVIEGVRYIHHDAYAPDVMNNLNTSPDYVGIPQGIEAPNEYNLNPTPGEQAINPHVSGLADMYQETSGPLLKARVMTAAEVNFILAEAANKGWNVGGSAKDFYNAGVEASLKAWGVGDKYDDYIKGSHVAFNGTLEQIITQKWIASFTMSEEAWFDWRRTGYPKFKLGPKVTQPRIPVRFMYPSDEEQLNTQNENAALKLLKQTTYANNENSAWSKPWIIQGTGQPW